MTASEERPPVEVMLDLAEAATDMNRLLAIDGAWTGAENAGELTTRDRDRLAALGSRLDAELEKVEGHVATVRNAFETYPAWVNARIAEALATESFTASQREGFPRKLAVEGGDFAGRGVALADTLKGRAPRERDEIQKKIRAIRGDGPVATDIDHDMACGVGALVSMGALAAGVGLDSLPLVAAGAVGLAVVLIVC
jgi:hypothetical protein